MKILLCEQRSPEWFAARCGIPTSSNFDKVVDTAGKPSKQREKYLFKLAGERIIGQSEETYQNAAMLRGIEMESEAREVYQFMTGVEVVPAGLCVIEDKIIHYGASPDGLVGTDGLLEIKCPLISTQVGYLLNNIFPSEYYQQVQGQLLVTGRKWVDFFSFYPGLKPLLIRVRPDEQFQKALKIELEIFCGSLEEVVSKIK